MLKYGLYCGKIPGFNHHLRSNFNHLMYVDDLVLITHASRAAARNINFCLSIYSSLIGQHPNLSKSQIFFPSWFNKHVSKRICSIIKLKPASFPFIYLGILVSPKRLAVASFKPMVDRISHTYHRWENFKLSPATKTVLINSSLMFIPTYTLSVYLIPETILSDITRVVRNFFWAKHSNGKGIHYVAWRNITESKIKRGLGVRNIALAKHSLIL